MRRISLILACLVLSVFMIQACSGDNNPVVTDNGNNTSTSASSDRDAINADAASCEATIGDFVWNDLNENGLQDQGEPGIPGVQVDLYTCWPGEFVGSTTTDENGFYEFQVLCGHYRVQFILPPDCEFTLSGQEGIRDANDSDPLDYPWWPLGSTECFTVTWDGGYQYDSSWDAGLICPPDSTPNPPDSSNCDDDGRPSVLRFQYTGDGCDGSDHDQSVGSVECSGDPNNASPVRIIVASRENLGHRNTVVWFDGMVALGAEFDIDAATQGTNRLSPNTYIWVFNQAGQQIHFVSFHTSCSQPLAVGDQFGTILITGFTPRP